MHGVKQIVRAFLNPHSGYELHQKYYLCPDDSSASQRKCDHSANASGWVVELLTVLGSGVSVR